MKASPINPQRLRRIPPQFSWIDHRLVRQGHLQRCDHAALSLYLFYLTVADAQGMSYYADPRLKTTLSMTQPQLNAARQCLIAQHLIACAQPFVQVLSLDEPMMEKPQANQKKRTEPNAKQQAKAATLSMGHENSKALIKNLRAQLRGSQ